MTLFSIVVVLLLEQMHALSAQRWVQVPVYWLIATLEEKFNDGGYGHGMLAWCLGVGAPVVLLMALHGVLLYFYPVPALVLGIAVLYLTLGLRQFSSYFTGIQEALQADDLDTARHLLATWRGRAGDRLTPSEVARIAIEQALLSSHRHVFAPMFLFVFFGPAGALLYRLALVFSETWGGRSELEFGRFGVFARRVFDWIDWAPLRVTAATFAIVGDFEDAVNCWRTQAARWPESGSGILLASGAGALGVRLGMPLHESMQESNELGDRPELGVGDEADLGFMQSTVGLVWRSLVLCLALLALVWVSGWVSGLVSG